MPSLRERVVLRLPQRWQWRLAQRHEYAFAVQWLGGLTGIEIGGSAHNRYPVDAINVDRAAVKDAKYLAEERRMAGRVLPVDIVASGDALPFADDSVDFVLASHVIEHFPDPIAALLEWRRVARRYVFLVVPHPDRTPDAGRPLTTLDELRERHRTGFTSDVDRHWSVWTCETFTELCEAIGLPVLATEDPDRKVGNGFAVVLDAAGTG